MNRHYSKESLSEIAGGDEEFMVVVAQTFIEEIPPDLEALEEAIENVNRDLAYQFAHKMKPNIEMFGIDVLKDITTIEAWTKSSKKVDAISENIEKAGSVIRKVCDELKEDFNL